MIIDAFISLECVGILIVVGIFRDAGIEPGHVR